MTEVQFYDWRLKPGWAAINPPDKLDVLGAGFSPSIRKNCAHTPTLNQANLERKGESVLFYSHLQPLAGGDNRSP